MNQPPKDQSDDAHPQRRMLSQQNTETLIDKLINQARGAGQFDNLAGTGKPLAEEDDSLVPEDMRAAYRMLKNAGYAPPWVEARREIDEERERIAAWLRDANRKWERLDAAARERLRKEYQEKLAALQRQIITHNLTSPGVAGQIDGLRMDAELHKLGNPA